jgi:hypothetical protein
MTTIAGTLVQPVNMPVFVDFDLRGWRTRHGERPLGNLGNFLEERQTVSSNSARAMTTACFSLAPW